MQCVVTGSTGCLGMNLTKRLLLDGWKVTALGRNPQLGLLLSSMGAEFIAVDLNDAQRLKQIIQPVDVVFHCAALSSLWGCYQDFYHANVQGTSHVIAAMAHKTRLVHVSSPSIYFDFTEKHNIKEYDPLPKRPANHYVKTKLQAEALIDSAYNQGFNVVTIRPRALFGPYDRSLIPRVLRSEKQGVLPVIGGGHNLIDMTYVDNVVEALLLASRASEHVIGKKYNITNDESKSLLSILQLLYDALQRPVRFQKVPYRLSRALAYCLEQWHTLMAWEEPVLTQYACGVLALGQTLNIDAAKRDLNYRPLITLSEGMQRFARWYQSSECAA